jgi:hypothetical protein
VSVVARQRNDFRGRRAATFPVNRRHPGSGNGDVALTHAGGFVEDATQPIDDLLMQALESFQLRLKSGGLTEPNQRQPTLGIMDRDGGSMKPHVVDVRGGCSVAHGFCFQFLIAKVAAIDKINTMKILVLAILSRKS